MRRMLDPLEKMGARVVEVAEGGRLPLTLQGAARSDADRLRAAGASAQLKSAVLLAGLQRPARPP